MDIKGIFRTQGVLTEQLVFAGRCRIYRLNPEVTTTGTITLRDGALADASGTIMSVSGIGLTQAGKEFHGAVFNKGVTIQLSVATDLASLIFEAF